MPPALTLLSQVSYRGRDVPGARLRGLLALLAGDLAAGCGTGRLVDGLWPQERPAHPAKAVQVLVSRARALLGPECIESTPTGYRLALPAGEVDAAAVLEHARVAAARARAGDAPAALAAAEAGLACWDGPPEEDAGSGDPLAALRADRAATYRSLLRARALALSRLGRAAEAVEPLAGVAADRPRDEEVLLELLRSEAATAGAAAALARYEAYRRALRDDLGADPGPALAGLHRQLLQQAAPAVRHGVPHEPNPLLGRADDIAAVTALLRTSRVTSIVGPGGLGKTRLATVVSRQAEQRLVHLVPLAGVTADADVAGEVASSLGVGDGGRVTAGTRGTVLAGIAAALGPGPALLVLDNCEHVVRGVAELVGALVATTRELRVLTTSRAPLGLSSESVHLLPELDLATSVELFGQRARAARPGVELPAGAVAELCGRLDGLPLAVELAAARVRVLSVPEIARRLADRFALLRGGPRDAPARHHTLQAVVDWSWQLLTPAGQAAMRTLSVLPGGFTAETAQELLGGGDALPVLEHLVDQSLLKVTDGPAGAGFRMLETVREYAAAAREAAGETDRAVDRLLARARDFGRAWHDAPLGPAPFPAADRIRAERDTLVAALRHGLARADGPSVAAAAAVLAAGWTVEFDYGRLGALCAETSWLLSHTRPAPDFVEVTRTALALGTTYGFALRGPRASRSLVALRRLPPAPPDTVVRAIAAVVAATPETDAAALAALVDSDHPLLAGVAAQAATYLWEAAGDPDAALAAAERMLAVIRPGLSPWLRVVATSRLAEMHLTAGRGAEALRCVRVAAEAQRDFGDWSDTLGVVGATAIASLQVGALDDVEHWLELSGAGVADSFGSRSFDQAVRGELLLARGEVDAGLARWRRAVELIERERLDDRGELGLEPWTLEIKAAAVVAHGRHDRADLVADTAEEVAGGLAGLLVRPSRELPFQTGPALLGLLLLALAAADLDRGRRTGDAAARRSGARLTALAERLRYLRQFQPTLSAAAARAAAEDADRPAYEAAVASYAGLAAQQLFDAARAALAERPARS